MYEKNIITYKRTPIIQLGTNNKTKQYTYRNKPRYLGRSAMYESGFIQPKGKYWKRQANKKVRRSNCYNGTYYKKLYGWFHWG